MRGQPRVLLVDGHALLAEAVAAALRADGIDARRADLTSRDELLATVEADPPDLVLLDLDLAGAVGEGTTLVQPFARSGTRVLVVSTEHRGTRIGTALEDGAVGHITRSVPLQELVTAVAAALRGDEIMPPAGRQALLDELRTTREQDAATRRPFERLTTREQQVLRELANGKVVATIAEEWGVSAATVRSQVRGVLAKLGVSSQLEAVALATRSGWLVDGDTDQPFVRGA